MKTQLFLLLLALLPYLGMAAEKAADKERLQVGGKLMLDADQFDSFWERDGSDNNREWMVRLARIQFEVDMPKKWEAKLQLNGALDDSDADAEFGSVYLRYTGWKGTDLTLGRMKEAQGLERNTSAAKLQTIERSMMTTAFTSDKSWGIHLFNANKKRRWALSAVVEDNQNNTYEEDPPVAVVGRYTWSPINSDEQTLQFGGSASWRDWNDNTFQVRNRAEVGSANKVVRSAEFIAEQQMVVGAEALWRHGGVQLQGEYMATRVEERDGPDWDYDGYYLTASYLIGGSQRRFREGEFRSLRPKTGAFEVVARHSYLNVRQHSLGSKAAVTTLGINYYYGRHWKFMLAYLHPDISGSVTHPNPDGDALSMRVQLSF